MLTEKPNGTCLHGGPSETGFEDTLEASSRLACDQGSDRANALQPPGLDAGFVERMATGLFELDHEGEGSQGGETEDVEREIAVLPYAQLRAGHTVDTGEHTIDEP
jgi:hypothetical protein